MNPLLHSLHLPPLMKGLPNQAFYRDWEKHPTVALFPSVPQSSRCTPTLCPWQAQRSAAAQVLQVLRTARAPRWMPLWSVCLKDLAPRRTKFIYQTKIKYSQLFLHNPPTHLMLHRKDTFWGCELFFQTFTCFRSVQVELD